MEAMREFIPIPGHNRYEISPNGVIRNVKTKRVKGQYIGSTGYYMVSFSYNNKSKPKRVHRLIATAFIPNPKGLPEVNHKDGNKINNRIENLEWITHEGNMRHAFKTGLLNNTGENNGQSKLNPDKVTAIRKYLSSGVSQQKIADKFNVSRSCIQGIKDGRLWSGQ